MKPSTKPEMLKCQSCGKTLPVSAFPKYSITKCRRCSAKTAASRRKEKRSGHSGS